MPNRTQIGFIAALMLLLGSSVAARAQDGGLPLQAGEVVFEDVVAADSLLADLLCGNAHRWLAAHKMHLTADSTNNGGCQLYATGEMPVYAQGYMSQHLNGVVRYRLRLETKAGKFRYRFDGFVFHYYHENRNYQQVPTGKTKPLAETKAPGWQKTWDYNRSTVRRNVENLVAGLKKQLLQPPTAEKVASRRW
ncbi:MAG: hypothetical protein MUD08_11895 [Cytophagales bacterium]|jgi:hypothetical protein|nr:hypothetical protein [Cytophagales bacterium]